VYYVAQTPLPKEATQAQTTILTDAAGRDLARLSGAENRVDVNIDQVPPVVINAVVATEDRGFFSHGAVDPAGILRALISDVRGHQLQGGSTITQQYVKNVFLSPKRTLGRKIREAVLSMKLERRYSKREILQRYLNTIYFGRGAYGVQAAARAYFGADVSKLDLNEAALLAGLIRAPVDADPAHSPARATARRNAALDALVATHHVTSAEAAAARAVPVLSFVKPSAAIADPTVIHREAGTDYFVAYVTAELVRRFGEATALGGGLRVKTTLNLDTQAQAYNSVYGVLSSPADPSGALVAIDPSGSVRAMVGGRDFGVSNVNLAAGAGGGGTGRQAGSTFKAFLLAEITNEHYSLLSQFAAPAEIVLPHADKGADYHVKNFDNESFPNPITLLDATKDSVNTVFAQAAQAIGPSHLVDMAHRLGVQTPLPANVSLVLGTSEVSPLEMAGAYSTFMNRGVRMIPQVIEEVDGPDGTVVTRANPQPTRVLPQSYSDIVTYALQQVVINGTGTGAKIGRPVAGKTGTTESSSDAWFIGYTPQLTTAVWMGYRDSKQAMLNVHGVKQVNGGSLPATIFQRFMRAALAGVRVEDFASVTNLPGATLNPPPVTLVTTTTSTSSTTSTTSTTLPAGASTTEPKGTTTSKPGHGTVPPPTTARAGPVATPP